MIYIFLCLIIFGVTLGDVLVFRTSTNISYTVYPDMPALFGPTLPMPGFKGYVMMADPVDGCIPLKKDFPLNETHHFIALILRYNCTFVQKVKNAQEAGYGAAIIRNVGSNSIEPMNGGSDGDSIIIPSVFIGADDGIELENKFSYHHGFCVMLTSDLPFNLQNYILPFVITIALCFLVMLIFMIVKCVRDYSRTRRHRLPSRSLKKLQVHKYKNGDPYECCAICLEDYIDNEKLRILPCAHAFHTKCIDPWLTKNRRVCPVCKRKVFTGDERPSDFESESEDETAPLLNSTHRSAGTFDSQGESSFDAAEHSRREYRHERRRRRRRRRRRQEERYAALQNEESGQADSESDGSCNCANENAETHSTQSAVSGSSNENAVANHISSDVKVGVDAISHAGPNQRISVASHSSSSSEEEEKRNYIV